MKTHLFLLPLLTLSPVWVSAQTQSSSPRATTRFTVAPRAKALLDHATATYKNAQHLRFDVRVLSDGQQQRTHIVEFSRPNLLRVRTQSQHKKHELLLDGTSFFGVDGTSYQRRQIKFTSQNVLGMLDGALAGSGIAPRFLTEMLAGRSPLEIELSGGRQAGARIETVVVALPLAVVDGESLEGVQMRSSQHVRSAEGNPYTIRSEATLWFEPSSGALRRVQSRRLDFPQSVASHIFSRADFNPITPDTFRFDSSGLTLDTTR